tara:strand:+ start:58 stop:606 length:549 start_codon:yes stop_codon:yes gene_type:complete
VTTPYLDNLFAVQVLCIPCKNAHAINDELLSISDKIDYQMHENWGNTHYLSDPEFNVSILHEYKPKLFMEQMSLNVRRYMKYTGKMGTPKVDTSWFALFKKHNYGHIHSHGKTDIAGVYYVKTRNTTGGLFFVDPIDDTRRKNYDSTEGTMILFPGWLKHGITTNTTDVDRLSLSFNIDLEL